MAKKTFSRMSIDRFKDTSYSGHRERRKIQVVLTVAADEENNEVDASENTQRCYTPVGFNSVIHDRIPIFARQNLFGPRRKIK
jgi:hypothetical protein